MQTDLRCEKADCQADGRVMVSGQLEGLTGTMELLGVMNMCIILKVMRAS